MIFYQIALGSDKEKFSKYIRHNGKWTLQYITGVSALLSQITAYREKNIELQLQAQGDLNHYCLHLIINIIHKILPSIIMN